MTPPEHKRVLSLGAGVQSTTVYLLALDGQIPPFDAAIFADTQEEPAGVYEHLKWLRSLGGPTIYIRTAGKLGDDLIAQRNSTGQPNLCSIPAYTAIPGLPPNGLVTRQCTKNYKIVVIEQTIRRVLFGRPAGLPLKRGDTVQQAVGISTDEARRSIGVWRSVESRQGWAADFPLLTLGWTRAACERYLRERVPHEVPRSACVFCPFKSDAEWRQLRDEEPDGWRRACEVDAGLRNGTSSIRRKHGAQAFLHRSAKPLADIDFDALAKEDSRQGWLGFAQECEGMCGV